MNAPLPMVTEIDTLPGAERDAFREQAAQLRDRADLLGNLTGAILAGQPVEALAADLRRAAALLEAAESGLATFPPHRATGLAVVPRADLDRLIATQLELVACMSFERPGVPRWTAAIHKAIAACEPFYQEGRV